MGYSDIMGAGALPYGTPIASIHQNHGAGEATRVVVDRLPADEVRPVESRAEVDALGDLHARRRTIIDRLAPLKALHGHNGIWDDKRKQMVEAMKVKARMALTEAGQKGTDKDVEAMAYADEMYERFIDQGITDRIAYITMQNELDEVLERIKDRELCLLVYNSEVKLDR